MKAAWCSIGHHYLQLTAAILVANVWKAPNVSKIYRKPDHCQQKLNVLVPNVSLLYGLAVDMFRRSSWLLVVCLVEYDSALVTWFSCGHNHACLFHGCRRRRARWATRLAPNSNALFVRTCHGLPVALASMHDHLLNALKMMMVVVVVVFVLIVVQY
jgi:hypothetical protein